MPISSVLRRFPLPLLVAMGCGSPWVGKVESNNVAENDVDTFRITGGPDDEGWIAMSGSGAGMDFSMRVEDPYLTGTWSGADNPKGFELEWAFPNGVVRELPGEYEADIYWEDEGDDEFFGTISFYPEDYSCSFTLTKKRDPKSKGGSGDDCLVGVWTAPSCNGQDGRIEFNSDGSGTVYSVDCTGQCSLESTFVDFQWTVLSETQVQMAYGYGESCGNPNPLDTTTVENISCEGDTLDLNGGIYTRS